MSLAAASSFSHALKLAWQFRHLEANMLLDLLFVVCRASALFNFFSLLTMSRPIISAISSSLSHFSFCFCRASAISSVDFRTLA